MFAIPITILCKFFGFIFFPWRLRRDIFAQKIPNISIQREGGKTHNLTKKWRSFFLSEWETNGKTRLTLTSFVNMTFSWRKSGCLVLIKIEFLLDPQSKLSLPSSYRLLCISIFPGICLVELGPAWE